MKPSINQRTRREFITHTSVGVAGLAAMEWKGLAATPVADEASPIPAHRAVTVPGVHAYTDQTSVAAGETVSFLVSSTVPYRLSVCRLGLKVDDPAGDRVLHDFPETQPLVQPIHPGSYAHVSRGVEGPIEGLTLECWVRPWKTDALAGVLTQYARDGTCLFGLFLTAKGGIGFHLSDPRTPGRSVFHTTGDGAVKAQHWLHVVVTWDGHEKIAWLNGEKLEAWPCETQLSGGPGSLRLGAGADHDAASQLLDGDLAMPVIYNRALHANEINQRFVEQGLVAARGKHVLACWPMREENGDRIADLSGNRRHGRIINHATWMIGGPSFRAEVPRYGEYDPSKDPKRGNGLRFASDDLYDCRWHVTHRFRLPANTKPGIHVGRIRFDLQGKPCLYHVTFIVRKPKRRKPAPILVLCATNTWRAYSGTPFGKNLPELKQVWGTNGIENSPGDPPAYCFYRGHAAGQGTYQLGFRMPWPVAGPYVLYGGKTDYSHLCRADRFLHAWLEQSGYDFDVVSDHDLHRDPGLLRNYRVFAINGHSEYWSLPMYHGLEKYLAGGGNVVCLSGNSLFWRVSYNDEGNILECRKVDAPGDQLPHERRGECWHSADGRRGGMMRECGYPGWKLIGLDTLGWNNQGDPRQFGPFIVEQPDHFLFNRPETVGLNSGDVLGQAPDGGLPRANGHEIDVRLSTLAGLQEQPAPPGATLPRDPAGMTRLANGVITWKIGGAAFDYFFRPLKPKTDQGGELIYWERPEGGRVLNAGSIGAGWGLLADPKFQTVIRNVLHHFGVTRRQ